MMCVFFVSACVQNFHSIPAAAGVCSFFFFIFILLRTILFFFFVCVCYPIYWRSHSVSDLRTRIQANMMYDARSGRSGCTRAVYACRQYTIYKFRYIYICNIWFTGWSTTSIVRIRTRMSDALNRSHQAERKKNVYRHNEMMVVVENDLALLHIKYNGLRYNPLFLGWITRPFYGDQSLRTSFFFFCLVWQRERVTFTWPFEVNVVVIYEFMIMFISRLKGDSMQ